jgi:multidrug efflux pump subunit AcrA (membrane-fusion protein)
VRKKVFISAGIIVAILLLVIFLGGNKDEKEVNIIVPVSSGPFKIEVNTSGELRAENSTKIIGPQGLRGIYIWNVKISDIVPEGTLVDSGDYVAALDKTEASEKLKDADLELESAQNRFINTQLDTTLELRGLRDNLVNLKYALEEAEIKLEQSKFEPPATIRQEEINLSKAKRTYDQSLENYKIKVEQSNAKMLEVSIALDKSKRKRENILKVLDQFTVKAPKSGMVIYARDWDGTKIKVGSTIGAWEPTVAELPDLNQMISITYVNEIDISKVKTGQTVTIGVDAFPALSFTGEVTSVANIGEQLKGSDAKVFEIIIRMNGNDTLLKPSMTTSNSILIAKYDSVMYVPLEAVFSNDSVSWVYKTEGLSTIRQQVITGQANENSIIIKKGLDLKDRVYLSMPKDAEKLDLKLLARQ